MISSKVYPRELLLAPGPSSLMGGATHGAGPGLRGPARTLGGAGLGPGPGPGSGPARGPKPGHQGGGRSLCNLPPTGAGRGARGQGPGPRKVYPRELLLAPGPWSLMGGATPFAQERIGNHGAVGLSVSPKRWSRFTVLGLILSF